jgi:hypothetical protein
MASRSVYAPQSECLACKCSPRRPFPQVYASKSESAREGMRLLLAEGVTMRAMSPEDWDFLVSLCNPEVRLRSPDCD